LCAIAERVLHHAHDDLWGKEWSYDDEDPLRETVVGIEGFRRWQASGEHPFEYLRPGLEPQLALADKVALGLSSLLAAWEEYGDPLEDGLETDAAKILGEYSSVRSVEWDSWRQP
jgi:hypothetical protein